MLNKAILFVPAETALPHSSHDNPKNGLTETVPLEDCRIRARLGAGSGGNEIVPIEVGGVRNRGEFDLHIGAGIAIGVDF